MFNNVVSYHSNEHSDSKRNFGLQSDLGQKLKETVNHYHNYNLQIKIKNEINQLHLATTLTPLNQLLLLTTQTTT